MKTGSRTIPDFPLPEGTPVFNKQEEYVPARKP
jgi:hypothetical protein